MKREKASNNREGKCVKKKKSNALWRCGSFFGSLLFIVRTDLGRDFFSSEPDGHARLPAAVPSTIYVSR